MCRRCGVYLAVVIPADHKDGACASINATALDAADRFTRSPVTVAHPDESAAERRSRRRSNWTPVVALVEG